jgi:hypothetical protein
MKTKSNMIRASHLAPPGESSSFSKISPSPIFKITNPELAKAYTKLRANSTVSEVTLKLAKLAQYSKMKLQSLSKETREPPTVLDLGTQTQGDQTHSHHEPSTTSYR